MSKRGLLLILSGPSGVGKGTVRKRLFDDKSLNLAYSISMTTRKARNGEIDGVDYFFVSKEEFCKNIQSGKLLEWAEFVGNYYGTPLEYVELLRNSGKNVVLEIEVEGAMQVKNKCPDALMIFLVPPSIQELERRIRGRRSEEEEIVNLRMEKARREMLLKDNYPHVIENNIIENAAEKITKIIYEYLK